MVDAVPAFRVDKIGDRKNYSRLSLMIQTENHGAWIPIVDLYGSISYRFFFFNLESLSCPQTHTYTRSVTVIVVIVFSSLVYFPKYLTVLQVCPR